MSDDITPQDPVDNTDVNTEDTQSAEETQPAYDFVLDKYRAEGRSEDEALQLQAKSYKELQSRFGSFTGAPEEYEASISDELKEAGVELLADDPLMTGAMEIAKDLNMNQEGFNKLVQLYAENQLADFKAMEEQRAAEFEALGKNANTRIEGVSKWIDANMDGETGEGLKTLLQTAAGFKAVEQLIAKTQPASVSTPDVSSAPSITESEVRDMQFAKDEFGNRRINTDPAFRREYQKKMEALHGTGEHRQMIGG